MSEMVERVVGALRKACGEADIFPGETGDGGKVILDGGVDMAALARAALEAMREPSEAMIAAGGTDSKWRVGEITAYASETGDLHAAFASDVWSAMVDAALKD